MARIVNLHPMRILHVPAVPMVARTALLLAALLLSVPLLAGCTTVGYYSQAIGGHLSLMRARQPIDELLADPDTDETLRTQLQTLTEARAFAIDALQLPDTDSYRTYAATGKRYITWNVIAAGEFTVSPTTWCFPVAGCVSYRGYFDEADAEAYAAELAEQGQDVTLGGASAYSTLGWFDDPVLDTMLSRDDLRYVSTLFHEMAHQKLYVKDDSSFNEAYATFVEQDSVRRWLIARDQASRIDGYDARLERGEQFVALLAQTRAELVTLYATEQPPAKMRTGKRATFERMRERYAALKASWDGYAGYDGWFARELNNARLVSVATYRRDVPAFAALMEDADGDLTVFHQLAAEVAALADAQRAERMDDLREAGQAAR